MRKFDKISIQEIPKRDLLLIIKALEYTGTHTNVDEFLDLKNNILMELSSLAESSKDEFLEYLHKS
ncbi:MAG: hypothetical protein GX329_06270 [Tissierellia bacterium]|nr:hypothetical protein [Tissierellia bacterium]